MDIRLPTTEQLEGLTNRWPLKDARPFWEQLYKMPLREFAKLVPYLEDPYSLIKPGRPTEIETLARTILFGMSEGQRLAAYKIIYKKALYLEV